MQYWALVYIHVLIRSTVLHSAGWLIGCCVYRQQSLTHRSVVDSTRCFVRKKPSTDYSGALHVEPFRNYRPSVQRQHVRVAEKTCLLLSSFFRTQCFSPHVVLVLTNIDMYASRCDNRIVMVVLSHSTWGQQKISLAVEWVVCWVPAAGIERQVCKRRTDGQA
jgi:hypothetical protein